MTKTKNAEKARIPEVVIDTLLKIAQRRNMLIIDQNQIEMERRLKEHAIEEGETYEAIDWAIKNKIFI